MSRYWPLPSLPPLPPLPQKWRRDAVLIAVVFVAIRLAVLAVFLARGRHFPFIDADGYIRHAAWLATHGTFVMPDAEGARYFSGMPLLVAGLGKLTGEFVWTGLLANAAAGIGAALLFYRNFPQLRWGLWHAALLPAWVSMTATFHSEAGLWCFCLLGLTAARLPRTTPSRLPLLAVAGYALVCRPTAIFILAPMLAANLSSPRPWLAILRDGVAMALLPLVTYILIRLDTGTFFPQSSWQAREFAGWAAHYGGGFPTGVFAWPGESFVAGFASPGVRLPIKLLNLLHFAAWAAGLALATRAWRRDPTDGLAAITTLELALNGAFILTIGGPFGHVIFYRFLATQANAFLLLAWLRHSRLPPGVWWAAAAGSVALAAAASRGG